MYLGKAFGFPQLSGAGNEARTRDLNLGKVALYQLSYSRVEVGADYDQPLGACQLLAGWFFMERQAMSR